MEQLEVVQGKLEELDAAKNYLNSDYYWKRRQELVSLIVLIKKTDIEKFNNNQTT